MRKARPEEAVTIGWSNQSSAAEERLDTEAFGNDPLAFEGPRCGVHGNVLGEEDHRYVRQTGVEDGKAEREHHDLTRFGVEGASGVCLGPRETHAWRATSQQDEGQTRELREPGDEAISISRGSQSGANCAIGVCH